MFHGIRRDELIISNDKKRLKGLKDVKRRDVNAPPLDRIPLPTLPEHIKNERRLAFRDIQLKKAKISAENPPTICLYSILNANNSVCCASISENCGLYAIGYGSADIQVDQLASEDLKVLKSAEELEAADEEGEATIDELYVENSGHDNKSIALIGHSGPIYSVSFSCERRLLLSGSRDRTMRLWSLEMQRNLVIYRTLAPVWQAVFCNRGVYFAAATADQMVSVWATDRTQPIRMFTDSTEDVTCLDFHPNCNYVIGGGDDCCVRVWDVLTANCVQTFAGHRAPIRAVKVSPCGRYIISADADGQVIAWDSSNQRAMGRQSCGEPIDIHVPIVFSRDGSAFAMATPRYGVTFFDADAMTNANNAANSEDANGSGYYAASSSQQQRKTLEQNRGDSFSMFSYPTKRTSILDFHFTRRNTVVAIGVFNQ